MIGKVSRETPSILFQPLTLGTMHGVVLFLNLTKMYQVSVSGFILVGGPVSIVRKKCYLK